MFQFLTYIVELIPAQVWGIIAIVGIGSLILVGCSRLIPDSSS